MLRAVCDKVFGSGGRVPRPHNAPTCGQQEAVRAHQGRSKEDVLHCRASKAKPVTRATDQQFTQTDAAHPAEAPCSRPAHSPQAGGRQCREAVSQPSGPHHSRVHQAGRQSRSLQASACREGRHQRGTRKGGCSSGGGDPQARSPADRCPRGPAAPARAH